MEIFLLMVSMGAKCHNATPNATPILMTISHCCIVAFCRCKKNKQRGRQGGVLSASPVIQRVVCRGLPFFVEEAAAGVIAIQI